MRRDGTGRLSTLLVVCALSAGGCGAGAAKLLHRGSSHDSSTTSAVGQVAPARAVRVIKGWSDALRTGHVNAAATYFRIPSVFYLGSGAPVQIRSRAQAEIVNAALPCGAQLISALQEGRYVNALFKLTDRPGRGGGGGCGSGVGQTARTNFLIENGQIVQWLRAPDQPGDNGSPRTAPAQPPPPTTPTSPGTTPGGGTPLI